MQRRRNHHGAPSQNVRRSLQVCVFMAAVALIWVVHSGSTAVDDARNEAHRDQPSVADVSMRIIKSSQNALLKFRDAGAVLHAQLNQSREKHRGAEVVQRAQRFFPPLRQSHLSQWVMDTSLAAKLPPSDPEGMRCRSLPSRRVTTIPPYYQCTHGFDDLVSSFVHRYGYWRDCLPQVALATLARMYMPANDDGTYSTLDVGGNIGTCSALLASRGFYVTAFEPVLRNLLAFHQTVFANGMQERVVLFGAAADEVSFAKKRITIEVGNHGNAAVLRDPKKSPEVASLIRSMEKADVEVITTIRLDDVLPPWTHFHFAKLDCQGCELSAIKGAEDPLLKTGSVDVLYVEIDTRLSRASGHDPIELLQILHRNSYRLLVAYGNATRVLEHAEFSAFVASCTDDPRDVVAVSPYFVRRVPEDVLRRVMSFSTETLETWLTNANITGYGSIPSELLFDAEARQSLVSP
jgi:FkbM family methyltransferase